jgi:hypothetical protein
MKAGNLVCQFKITLAEISPPIWRSIQVPMKYNFWDLHVALQDSMGWLDYHLHAFCLRRPHKKTPLEIGIPGDEMDDDVILPGWEVAISDYFTEPGNAAVYEYDFGDGWEHELLLEGILLKEKGVNYPRCIAGERACPPEDCGGVPGYYRIMEILGDPSDDEYQETVDWLKGHAKNYYPYRPDEFQPENVRFDNPKRRWKIAFSQRSAAASLRVDRKRRKSESDPVGMPGPTED